MKNAWHALQAALITFTRMPLSGSQLTATHFAAAFAWLPAAGLCIGLLSAAIYWLAALFVPADIAVLIALIAGILLTGALHEDGFADCCDGFAASRDPQTILRIMKDPANGSFATLGLIALFSGKLLLLINLLPELHIAAFIAMHTLARWTPLLLVSSTAHCGHTHSKMSGGLQLSRQQLWLVSLLLLAGSLLLLPVLLAISLMAGLVVLTALCRHFFMRRLNGYNGDCLGATEQVAECLILLLFVVYS